MRLWGVVFVAASVFLSSGTQAKEPSGESRVRPPEFVPREAFRRSGRWIESGLRLERSSTGLKVAHSVFGTGGEPQGMELPAHLGGGFLFLQPNARRARAETAFYRAASFTGPLRPLGSVPFAVHAVHAGFDRLYLIGTGQQVGLDIDTGDILGLDPLPPVVAVQDMNFAGPRRAVVSAPLVGVLYTADAGITWKQLPGAYAVEHHFDPDQLIVRTRKGLHVVEEDGSLSVYSRGRRQFGMIGLLGHRDSRVSLPSELQVRSSAADAPSSGADDDRRMLSELLLRGAPGKDAAYAVRRGQLLRVSLDARLELKSFETAIDDEAECLAVEAEPDSDPLFVCQSTGTAVYRMKRKGKKATPELSRLQRFSERREILATGPGAVLVDGDCPTGPHRKTAQRACLVTDKGRFPVGSPRKSTPGRQSWAVSSSSVWEIFPDKKEKKLHAHVRWSNKKKFKKMSWLLPSDLSIVDFFESGALLPQGNQLEESLQVWAVHREKLVGVHLGEGAQPSFGAVQRPLRRAMIQGPRALIWGAAGFAKQSLNGGLVFEEVSYPYRSGDADLSRLPGDRAGLQMGCSPVGCSLGRFLRFGWDTQESREVESPELKSIPPTRAGRFQLSCRAGEVTTPPGLPRVKEELRPFWEKRAPTLEPGDEGYSVAFPQNLARLYAWGPKEASWSRGGAAQLRFIDRWSPGKVYETAPTRQIFSSGLHAQEEMGLLQRSTGSTTVVFDAAGDRGAFVLRNRSKVELFTFAADKPVERVPGAQEHGARNLTSVVQGQGGRWFASFQSGSFMHIFELKPTGMSLIAQLPLGDAGARSPRLVRTVVGHLGISFPGDPGLLIYPLSTGGQLGHPVVVPPPTSRPETCPDEARGFIVDLQLSLAPYLQTPSGKALDAHSVGARLIAGHGDPCLVSLTGTTRQTVQSEPGEARSVPLPLSLLNAEPGGNRTQLLCE